MNFSPHSSDPAAEEAAALWAARLDGSELSAADRSELDAWLAAHPSHRELLSGYCQFSADLEQPLATLVETGAVKLPSPSASPHRAARWKLLTASAFVAIAATLTVAVWMAQPRSEFSTLASPLAQRQSVTLSDGTFVELNAHTNLQVAINQSERRVRLISGEAYFAVSKDPARPFVIETPAGSVRVTGTTFSVRAVDASSLEVTVVEGSVQVRPGDTGSLSSPPVILRAGDKLSTDGPGVSLNALSPAALDDALAWRRGQIVFDGVPLRQALSRFAHYHGRAMVATDASGDLPLGGRYSLDDPQGFFRALAEFFPVSVETASDGSVKVSLRSAR